MSDKNVSIHQKWLLFLKGVLIGLFDVIPGISGGTIALILGIYEELIFSIKGVLNRSFIKKIYNSIFKEKNVSFILGDSKLKFLTLIFSGVLISIYLTSYITLYFLKYHKSIILTLFVGLIVGSFCFLYPRISYRMLDIIFALLGFLLGFLMIFIHKSFQNSVSMLYIYLGGFFAVFAMLLPGISGSFVLYAMGLYVKIYSSLHSFNLRILIPFLVGAVTGAFFSTKVISFFLERYESRTLNLLIGFIFGSLFVPIFEILKEIKYKDTFFNFLLVFIFICSALIPILIDLFLKKKRFSGNKSYKSF